MDLCLLALKAWEFSRMQECQNVIDTGCKLFEQDFRLLALKAGYQTGV